MVRNVSLFLNCTVAQDVYKRQALVLPNGTGKTTRVAVFAQGAQAEAAKAAGADVVGFEDLAEQVKAGVMDFDLSLIHI